MKNKFTYIILGYARTGTSFLTKALESQGVYVGNRFYCNSRNPRGGFENDDFVWINKKILSDCGSPSIQDFPPALEDIKEKAKKHKALIKKAVNGNKRQRWGFKDPRTSLTLDVWLPEILKHDDDPFFYIAVRRPDKAVESLKRRNCTVNTELALRTAKEYYRRIIKFLEDYLEL